jgi:hypothetical protein
MANKKKTIGEWIDSVFGKSYKTISEKLSVEEHDHFIQDVTQLQAQVLAQEGDDAEASEENKETESAGTEASDTETGSNSAANASFEQRLSALEATLKKEQIAKAELQTKLTQTEAQLKTAQDANKKLRDSVNPLGDQDAANASQEEKHLTKTDIEARAAWKANQESEA